MSEDGQPGTAAAGSIVTRNPPKFYRSPISVLLHGEELYGLAYPVVPFQSSVALVRGTTVACAHAPVSAEIANTSLLSRLLSPTWILYQSS